MSELITIIIPCYNDHAALSEMLDNNASAVLGKPFRIIVVDDCSPESGSPLIEALQKKFGSQLNYHKLSKNVGPGGARNFGMDLVETPFFSFIDADDGISPSYIHFTLEACRNIDFDVAMFKHHFSTDHADQYSYRMLESDEIIWERYAKEYGPEDVIPIWKAPYLTHTINYPWNKIYRTDYMRKFNVRFPDLRMHEDVPFHWSALMHCERMVCLTEFPPLVQHNRSQGRDRATDHAGKMRLDLVDSGVLVFQEINNHPHLKMFYPVFARFLLDVFEWAESTIEPAYREALIAGVWEMMHKFINPPVMHYIKQVDQDLVDKLETKFPAFKAREANR